MQPAAPEQSTRAERPHGDSQPHNAEARELPIPIIAGERPCAEDEGISAPARRARVNRFTCGRGRIFTQCIAEMHFSA